MGERRDGEDDEGEEGIGAPSGGDPADGVVELPIEDVLDLHGFLPREVADVVRSYLDAAFAAGLRRVRLIHGKGIGVQRAAVRALLARDPRVVAFGDLPGEQGGWGATWVDLAEPGDSGDRLGAAARDA
jgi:dsDNA-specific endonuclease/ATPase MutS2